MFLFPPLKSFHWADGRDIIDGFRRPEWTPATGDAPHGRKWINHLQAPTWQLPKQQAPVSPRIPPTLGYLSTLQGPSLDVWLHWRQRTWWISPVTIQGNHHCITKHPQPAAWAWTRDTTFPWKSSEMIDSLDRLDDDHGHPWTLSQISSGFQWNKKKSGIYMDLL